MANLYCNITPIQLFGCHELNNFSWIRSSSQQDTLLGQQIDGPISVLKIKEDGIISRFVLDPHLVCAHWDDEDFRLNCQRLFGQTKKGDIVVYTVNSEGVTEVMHLLASKLMSLIDPAHHGTSPDAPMHLVACEQGHIILTVDTTIVASVQVTSSGSLLPGCVLCLPCQDQSASKFGDVEQKVDLFQVVNGIFCLFDHSRNIMSMHPVSSGECVCKIDLSPLSHDMPDLICWKMSYDHSSIMIVTNDLHVHRIFISSYAKDYPQAVLTINKNGEEKSFDHEYFSYHLCRFGDSSWKREITRYHMQATEGKLKENVKKSINGFEISRKRNPKSRSNSQASSEMTTCHLMELSNNLKDENWTLSAVEATSGVLTMLLSRKGSKEDEKAIAFANFHKNNFHRHRLEDSSCVIQCSKPSSPQLIWTDGHIKYLAPDPGIHKDHLISSLMSYSGPHAADNLCQVNKWTRTAIPLAALEASLQHRQLDTLAFYFKSKQKLFSSMKHSQKLAHLSGEMQQLESVLQLVMKVVAAGVKESQSRLFAQRLLSITLDFLYSLLEDARECLLFGSDVDKSLVLDDAIQQSCDQLQPHVSSLRNFMKLFRYRPPSHLSNSLERSVLEGTAAPVDDVDAESNVCIEQYIKDNKLTQLQGIMVGKNTGGSTTYKKLLVQVFRNVHKHLRSKDISTSQHLLANLGCDVKQTVWKLSQFYDDRALQEFITSQLLGTGLSQEQHRVVELMKQLYKAYPNTSFRNAMDKRNKFHSNYWDENDGHLKEIIPATNVFLPSHFTDFDDSVDSKDRESESHLYSSVLLAWLSQWSDDSKHRVFIDAKFLSSVGGTADALSILKDDPQWAWRFLISHNLIDTIQDLLKNVTSNDDEFPWPPDMLSSLQMGSSYLCKELLRQFLKIGKLCLKSAKAHDIDVLSLLPTVGGPMKQPHVLAYTDSEALMKFHHDFIVSCITQGLQLPLWIYCTVHRIDIQNFSLEHKTSWFSSFQLLHVISKQPKERSLMVTASKLSAGDLWSRPSTPMSVETMLDQGHPMAAMATLSYMSQCEELLDLTLVRKHLHQFPKLILALMPGNGPSSKHVTSVYELLMGNVPFNLRRLFGWHATNPYAGEDSSKFMPHFSEPSMTELRPHRRKLAFPFFLNQGRPVYAFQAFMCEELDRRDSPVSEKRIHQACGVSLWLACKNFNTSYITSACTVFMELLGQDSALVRSIIHAGHLILTSRTRNLVDEDKRRSQEDRKKIEEETQKVVDGISLELQACVQSRQRHGAKFIACMQIVTLELIDSDGLDRTGYEASHKWLLVIMLCQLLRLPLSTTFLEICAQSDNWFMFVWFAQLHQYPTHQLLSILHHFRSSCYRDHLHYVVYNSENKLFSPTQQLPDGSSGSLDSSFPKGASIDQRASLYQKFGVSRDAETVPSSSEDNDDDEEDDKKRGSDSAMSSFSSRIRHAQAHECEMSESTAPDDVFRLLFYSQSMPCQWRCLLAACVSLRNPLFAELAASCGCPPVPSICGWLLASLTESSKQQFLNQHGQLVSRWRYDHLESLIDVVLEGGCEDALATAFAILQPASPLTPFFSFVHECVKKGKYASTKTYLNQFKDAMATYEVTSASDKSPELATVGDRVWMEKVVYQVLCFYLMHVKSMYQAYHLLGILDTNNIALVFSFDVLNFSLLYQVVEIIHDNEIPNIDLASLLKSGTSSPAFTCQCEGAIDHLLQEGKFEWAMKLSEITKISREKVALGQLKAEKHKLLQCQVWTSKNVRIHFWERACKLMLESSCSYEACEAFFTEELKGTCIDYEKALLCQHLLTLLDSGDDSDLEVKRENVFRNMWKHRIATRMSIEDEEPLDRIFSEGLVKTKKVEYLKSEIAGTNADSQAHRDTQEDLNSEEIEVLDSLIGNYLDTGKVRACSKVAEVFGHYNQNLTIIQTCISLASGECTLDRIEPAMKRLVTKTSPHKSAWMKRASFSRSRTLSTSSFDLVSSNAAAAAECEFVSKNQETNTLMERLFEHCVKGRQVCLRIITCYKMTEIIEQTYQDIVLSEEFGVLKKILKTEHPERFHLARNFLTTSGLSDDEVTLFLADSIVNMLKKMMQVNSSDDAQSDNQRQPYNSNDGTEIFSQYLMLCENTSLLGDRILQSVASFLSEDDEENSANVLTIQTEMIIMAHKCYTSASNMEGISHVLRAARVCSNCLAQAGEFNLMIRLLLGVGRYSEMMYIFHALQQNHQFELLLKKGMDRENKLKVAILDYLKRYEPDDSEAYTMVALKFTMFRDIAAMLEKCGHKTLNTLKNKNPLDNTKETQDLLKKCLQFFKDAAESYVKDESIRKAQHCVKLARLVSVQLQLLSNGTTVIHLSHAEVTSFINTHTRFIEAMVVSDAYERRSTWAEAVFNNVIMGGEKSYLQEMQLHVQITSPLIEDVADLYKKSVAKTNTALTGIKKLLSLCKDVKLRFKLATDLGLSELVTAMMKSDIGCYLQDVAVP